MDERVGQGKIYHTESTFWPEAGFQHLSKFQWHNSRFLWLTRSSLRNGIGEVGTWSSRPDVACIGPGHVLPCELCFALLCFALLCMGGSLRLTYTQLLHGKKRNLSSYLTTSKHSLPSEIAARQASYTISLFSISEERFPETIYPPCLRRWDVISQTVLLLLLLIGR